MPRPVRRPPCLLPALFATVLAAACGGGAETAPPQAPVSTEAVREQVRLYANGSGDKDAAGEVFHAWGTAAEPGLVALAADPSLADEEMDAMMLIASVYVHTPAVFDALRARLSADPDAEYRAVRLRLLDTLQAAAPIAGT